jgi:hypothetical protein
MCHHAIAFLIKLYQGPSVLIILCQGPSILIFYIPINLNEQKCITCS